MATLNIFPDWQNVWTPAQAEEQLEGFKFNGPGWYFEKGNDTILVIPMARHKRAVWHQKMKEKDFDPNEQFLFMVYNQRNPTEDFGYITSAPTRRDALTDDLFVNNEEKEKT